MPIIMNHVNCIYEPGTGMEVAALKDINLVIPDGQFVGLIGHTGSGKSTLIRHLNGLLKATSGTVYYNGQDIYDKDFSLKELRGKVGLVFQYPERQLFESSVLEDVRFGPKNLGIDDLHVDLRAYEALKLVGIEEKYHDSSPFELSGGQKRRVAIAGVLAMRPEVLILDEPTAGLDPRGRDDIMNLIHKIHDENNITVIIVSHNMEDMAKHVERIIVMKQGRIALDDTPKRIFAHVNELEQMGLMPPQITMAAKKLKQRGILIEGTEITIEEAKNSILFFLNKHTERG
jgi:energy-coupling factor transport system ATP-binding protein